MNNRKTNIVLMLAACMILVLIILMITMTGTKKRQTVTVGFIMTGNIQEQGWNRLHYEGIQQACKETDMKLLVKENVEEYSGQCEQAIHELAEEKVDIIILSSYGYASEVLDVVKEYPDITFYSESFEYSDDNLKGYFGRIYQARYLSGIIAGMQTEQDNIGYVAAMANCEVNRGINAFTLGVQQVNPDAKVFVAWSQAWDDPEREKELAKALIEEKNVDVITYHQNQPNVIDVAEELQVDSIGYHHAVTESSEHFLTAVVFNWDLIYKELLLDYMRGKSDVMERYWFGIDKDAIGLVDYSTSVHSEAISEVEKARKNILDGFDVFSGEIYDNTGMLRSKDDETISDKALLKDMDWYVKGVEFYDKN